MKLDHDSLLLTEFLFTALAFYRELTVGNSWFFISYSATPITIKLSDDLIKEWIKGTKNAMSCWKSKGITQQ